MPLVVNVEKGTFAGWDTRRPKPTKRWRCECRVELTGDVRTPFHLRAWVAKVNPPFLVNCPDCGARRP